MAAFKQHCTFGFWKGDLVVGTSRRGAGNAMGQFGRITDLADLPREKVLAGYIRKAAELNDSGVKKPSAPKSKQKKELVVPDYFMAVFKKNSRALATFENFSYSHRQEYVRWITEAKQEETRQRRIATALEWLATGKARHWKYASC